jgi:hypothetical protein
VDGAAASVTTVAAAAEALTDDIVGCFTSIATSDVVARTIRGDLATLASVPVSRSLSSPLLSKRWVPLSVMCTLPRFGDGTGDASSTRTFTASSAPSSTVVGCTVPAICGAAGRFPAAYASFPRRAARRFAAFFALPPSTPSVFGGAVAKKSLVNPKGTVHVVEGNGGVPGVHHRYMTGHLPKACNRTAPQEPPSPMDIFRMCDVGENYGRLVTTNASVLTYEHVDNARENVTDSWSIVKTGARQM